MTSREKLGNSGRGVVFSLAILSVAAVLWCASSAAASFGVDGGGFTNTAKDAGGVQLTQAGAHPDITTGFTLNTALDPYGNIVPDEDLRDVKVQWPAGLLGNPNAIPVCPHNLFSSDLCPTETQVGIARVQSSIGAGIPAGEGLFPVFNLAAVAGVPAELGFRFGRNNVTVTTALRATGNYEVTATIENIPGGVLLFGSSITLWGIPAASSHDSLRFRAGVTIPGDENGNPIPVSTDPKPFITSPATCGATTLAHLEVDSWQHPGVWDAADALMPTPTGCDKLNFNPSFTAQPAAITADTPTGLSVNFSFAQDENPNRLSTSPLKTARVVFPEGVSVNQSSADGLQACSDAQLALKSDVPLACPDASKLGSVTATSPLLDKGLSGNVYLRTQNADDPESGQMLRLALVIENPERGISIRLPGQVRANRVTGQLEAVFADNPQLPVETISVNLRGGNRAPLLTPPTCGTYTSKSVMTSWAAPDEPVVLSDSFQITSGPNGTPCPAPGFDPTFLGETLTPIAGIHTPLVIDASRPDGSQPITGLSVSLPPGLLGKLAGIPYCPQASLEAAAANRGRVELAAPSCPVASRVGGVDVGAGGGTNPFHVSGNAYLAGPYRGGPLSLAVITPAVAGPFDLGTVVTRAALRLDPTTAQITAVSDPIPTILQGIPLHVRSIEVKADRPEFILNPTSCKAMSVGATLFAPSASRDLSNRFQVGACNALGFKPKLAISLKGATRRGGFPQLTATLRARKGDANIGRASVALPHSEFLAQSHIRTICTRVQYAADQCPAASVYGHARAISPLLDQPLEGPVYLRSSDNELPDLVAALHGQIDVDLVGRIDSKNGGIRTTFATVPDAPVSKFVLKMKGGKRSLLENSRNLCRTTNKATVKLKGQNGRAADFRPVVRAAACGKSRRQAGSN
jgi:hypothetical protein